MHGKIIIIICLFFNAKYSWYSHNIVVRKPLLYLFNILKHYYKLHIWKKIKTENTYLQ